MPTLYLRDVPKPLLESLRARAASERRSVSQEAVFLLARILERDRGPNPRLLAILEEARRGRERRHRAGRRFPPSERMVREERERE